MFVYIISACQTFTYQMHISRYVWKCLSLQGSFFLERSSYVTPSSCFLGTFIHHFYVFSMNLYCKGQICSPCLGTIVPGANQAKSYQCCRQCLHRLSRLNRSVLFLPINVHRKHEKMLNKSSYKKEDRCCPFSLKPNIKSKLPLVYVLVYAILSSATRIVFFLPMT